MKSHRIDKPTYCLSARLQYTIQKAYEAIDIRINTYYNISMIRKGDTKDANDFKRDDFISQKERFRSYQSEWFTRKNVQPIDWENSNCSLSLQRPEKRDGAGNIETGWVEINPAL